MNIAFVVAVVSFGLLVIAFTVSGISEVLATDLDKPTQRADTVNKWSLIACVVLIGVTVLSLLAGFIIAYISGGAE